jgi:hypothetical protein
MLQKHDHTIWKIIELFYKSWLMYRQMHDIYEEKVANYSRERNVRREDLKLGPADLAGLIDFLKLEQLRDRYLFSLKTHCHDIFRGHGNTDQLDRYVSDIFHEISILKEEHYTVQHYAPGWADTHAEMELNSIMQEAIEVFPRKIHHVYYLFRNAIERIEKLLPHYRKNRILLRSLFLNRKGFIAAAYPKGLDTFYTFLFPGPGPLEGYYETGVSFFKSAFHDLAIESFKAGTRYLETHRSAREAHPGFAKKLSDHIRKAEEELVKTEEKKKAYSAQQDKRS